MSPTKSVKRRVADRNVAKGKPAAGAATAAQLLAPEGPKELIVRMYRQGLGDCFLLALPASNGRAKYVLIDCGVHARQTKGPERLAQVMDHLVAATGSSIDVVVATHEHADHLSGFVQKSSPFIKDNLTIGELWVAWTEKRGDRQADALRQKRGTAQQLIEKAVEEARQRAGVGGTALAEQLLQLTDFDRPATGSVDVAAVVQKIKTLKGKCPLMTAVDELPALNITPALGAAKKTSGKTKSPSSNELALRLLALKAGDNGPAFCEPGSVRQIDGVANLRAYVMGPPRSDLLERDKPSKIRGAREHDPGGAYKEVYLTASQANRALELSPRFQLEASAIGGPLPDDWRYPFPLPFRRQCELSQRRCWRTEPPPRTKSLVKETYLAPAAAWRRIDGDWLGAAETLALNLASDTNNSSLVLAFEWGQPGRGRVLLFAADAQVGNWLSWRDQPYGDDKLKVDDLLSRVVLYKVGHHGSHNATVRRDPRDQSSSDPIGAPFGLELMNDIVALITVDGAAARKNMPDPWKMPHEPLYRRCARKRAAGSCDRILSSTRWLRAKIPTWSPLRPHGSRSRDWRASAGESPPRRSRSERRDHCATT
jgi:hypothetical protein